MAGIAEIPGIDESTQDLFRAAGIDSSGKLMEVSLADLMTTLAEVNGERNLLKKLPPESAVASWQSAARIFEGTATGADREVHIPSSIMATARITGLPIAAIVPSEQLRAAGVKASSVPIGRLVEQVAGTLRLAGSEAGEAAQSHREKADQEKVDRAEDAAKAPQAVLGRPVKQLQAKVAPEKETSRKFREVTEERKAQIGLERRNNGMSHKEPMRVYLGAIASLISMFLVTVGFVAVAAALARSWYFQEPVPVGEAVVLVVFPVALLIYVGFAMRARCRLCGQRLFLPRQCRKHQRAHRSIFGYLFALSAHILAHRWFRCMLCGTKQRLKE